MLRQLRNLRVPSPRVRVVALTVAALIFVAATIAIFIGGRRSSKAPETTVRRSNVKYAHNISPQAGDSRSAPERLAQSHDRIEHHLSGSIKNVSKMRKS